MQLLGWVLVALAVAQLVPAGCAIWWGEPPLPYLASAIAAGVTGLPVALGSEPIARQLGDEVSRLTRDVMDLVDGKRGRKRKRNRSEEEE